MRQKMFEAICDILTRHNNEDYNCAELMELEDKYNATIYTFDASDLRLAANEIIDLIADFFIKGIELRNEKEGEK